MANIRIFKETSLPGVLAANAVYLIAPAAGPADYCEVYVTDNAGAASRHLPTRTEIQAMIDAAVAAGSGGTVIVDDIAARDAIDADNAQTVYVVDASADPTVAAGGASYIWRESSGAWIKMSEAESLDISLAWAGISGRPASTPAEIDAAVTQRHVHANISELNKIGEDGSGNMTYDGAQPYSPWASTGW